MKKFPLFIDLNNRKILLVGGGAIAERRTKVLCQFCENIHLVATGFTPSLQQMKDEGKITLEKRMYQSGDCKGMYLVLAATNDPALNERIVQEAKQEGAFVNACHDKSLCDFYFPGIVTQGEHVVIGVSASGEEHKKAAEMRKKIADLVGGEH